MSTTALRLYSAPEGVESSPDYMVTVNGQALFVHQARVSAQVENQVWPGHQRPIEQSNLSAFAYCDASGLLSVEVECLREVPENVILHPQSTGIKHELQEKTIRFELIGSAHVVLEINNWSTTFQLFVNPLENETVNEAQENMLYYGPGIHDAGEIRPENGQTIYIHGEAIVYGTIYAKDKTNITLRGRGILDSSRVERTTSGFEPNDPLRPAVGFFHCSDLTVDGIILRDSPCYSLFFIDCANVEVDRLKIIGQWRYNTDGIDIYSSRNVTVRDCFIRSFDDSIALKAGRKIFGYDSVTYPMEHIRIERCMIWNDWGKALEIGVECETEYIRDIEFRDIDILHFVFFAISVANGNEAKISNVLFDEIRIYTSDSGSCFMQAVIAETFWAPGDQRGSIHDVVLRRISLDRLRPSHMNGFSQNYAVRNIVFDHFVIGGQQVADVESAGIKIGEYAEVPRFLLE